MKGTCPPAAPSASCSPPGRTTLPVRNGTTSAPKPPRTELPDDREWPERRTRGLEDEPPGGRRGRRGARPRGRAPAPPPRSQADDFPFERQTPPADDLGAAFEPDPRDRIPDRGETSPLEGPPPREHGGRAAIRARGGNLDRPRDPQAPSEPAPPRYARGHAGPGGSDTERRPHGAPDRHAEPERRRPSEPPRDRDRDRDRTPPHARAGEPGYVPRRERLRSADSAFGSDIFPPDSEWPERAAEADLPGDTRSRTGDTATDDADFESGAAAPGLPGDARNDPRRRRRRGRRRERDRGRPPDRATGAFGSGRRSGPRLRRFSCGCRLTLVLRPRRSSRRRCSARSRRARAWGCTTGQAPAAGRRRIRTARARPRTSLAGR